MALTEGVAGDLRYKFYSVGTMDANSIADPEDSTLGASGAQLLRRVSVGLQHRKTATRSNEILPSRQVRVFRQSGQRVEGPVEGELSPATYFDWFEAVHRDTAASFSAGDASDYVSVTCDEATSTITLGGGDPVGDGLRVGDIVRFSGLSDDANNDVNFLIIGMSGTNGRTLTVHPAPSTMSADTSFTLARPGLASMIPSASNFVRRKLAIEAHRQDIDSSRLFEECRLTGYRVTAPAEGIVGVTFDVMGRRQTRLTGSNAPFFTNPTAITTTDGCDTINGLIRVNGQTIGVATSLNLALSLNADAPRTMQKFPPDILLGTADVTGELGVLVDDGNLADVFDSETEFEILCWLTSSTADNADSVVFYLPRCKASSYDETMQGEGSQAATLAFQALEYVGSATGVPTTTIRMVDTAAS